MKKKIIAVDIDDVLGNENEAIRQFMNAEYGFNHTPEDYRTEGEYWGYWESVWGVDKETGAAMYDKYVNAGGKATHKPVAGAIAAIQQLKKTYTLVIVTMRGDRHVDQTHTWLAEHFPETFDRVEFLPLWGDRSEITKAHIVKELGASYLVDDSVEHCTLAAEAGIPALLFGRYGWNKRFEAAGLVHRVDNWQQVLEYFDGKA